MANTYQAEKRLQENLIKLRTYITTAEFAIMDCAIEGSYLEEVREQAAKMRRSVLAIQDQCAIIENAVKTAKQLKGK